MQGLSFYRAIKNGVVNFFRNGWLSITATGVMALTLLVMSILFSVLFLANQVLFDIENKIGMNVFLRSDISENKIVEIKEDLSTIPSVIKVDFTSKEQALAEFKEKKKYDSMVQGVLDELPDNPLEASLRIKLSDSSRYANLESELLAGKYREFISKVDYSEHRETIDKLNKVIISVKKGGIFLILLLVIITVLVAFNSIRLAMYTHKNEIEIMKLVGASNWFIRLPFITEGLLYGIFASLFIIILCYPLALYFSPHLFKIGLNVDIIGLFKGYWWLIFCVQFAIGASLGIISSIIAIHRYLKI